MELRPLSVHRGDVGDAPAPTTPKGNKYHMAIGQRGFTLLEMLLVLAIMAMVLAVAPPLLSAAMPGLQLKGSARSIAAALRQARSKAITEGRATTLDVDLEQRQAQVDGSGNSVSIPSSIEIVLTTADQELTDEQHGRIRFYPDGTSTGGRVALKHGSSGYDIDVDWLTGRIQIKATAGD